MTQFDQFAKQIPHGEYDTFRKRVIQECEITDAYFRMWYNGYNVPSVHHDKINKISLEMFGRKIFE